MAERDFNLQMTGEQVKDALQQLEDRVAEGWAVGEHDGVPVTSGSPYFENNSKWWAQQAGLSAQAAADSAAAAEQEVEEGIRQGIVGTYVQESATPGAIVTIDDGADNIPLKDLKVNLDINQPGTGDPSPTNVRPIYPVTEAEVSRTGKNILDFDSVASASTGWAKDGDYWVGACSNLPGVIWKNDLNYQGQVTISAKGYGASGANFRFKFYYTDGTTSDGTTFPTSETTISKTSTSGKVVARIGRDYSSGLTVHLKDVQLEFGSTATAYTPYAGQQHLVNIGINQWDEQWELGAIDQGTGENVAASNQIRSKNNIAVIPNTDYYIKSPYVTGLRFYGAGGTYKGYLNNKQNSIATIPADAYYMRFVAVSTTSSADISINYPSRFTSYYPYTGNVVYGGELDVTAGVLTVKYGVIPNLGGISWQLFPTATGKNCYLSDVIAGAKAGSGIPNLYCEIYKTVRAAATQQVLVNQGENVISTNTLNKVFIYDARNPSTSDAFKALVQGVPAYYELATPISIQLTPTEVDTLRGDNVIWADCGDITNCEYRADLKMYIDKVIGA